MSRVAVAAVAKNEQTFPYLLLLTLYAYNGLYYSGFRQTQPFLMVKQIKIAFWAPWILR
jgi:hypothetical protein